MPDRHRRFSQQVRIVLFIALGLLVGGGSFLPNWSSLPASADGTTKTIVRSATLQTTDQNMWGEGTTSPLNQTLELFHETWDEGGGFDGVSRPCVSFGELGDVCGSFGAGFNASVSGEIGMSIGLEGLDGGKVTVTYPVTVTFTAPADNSFDPGDEVEILTSMVVDPENATIVAEFPGLDRISWNGAFAFAADASGRFCVFDCVNGSIFDIDFAADGEILGWDPSITNGCFNFLINFPAGLSQYPNERCNNNGYVFNPDPKVASFLHSDGSITASGQDQFAVIPVSAVTWAGRLAGLPPYIQLNLGEVSLGGVRIGWTTFNQIITAIETMKQDFLFSPRVDVNLDWGKDLNFRVLDGNTNAQLQSANATNATFKVGDKLMLTTNTLNNKIIPIKPTLIMGSATLANHTRSETSGDLGMKALSFTLRTPDWEECLGEICLELWGGSNINWGPVWEQHTSLGSAPEHTIFNGSFALTGFNAPELDAFDLVPRPIVEVRKKVMPPNAPGFFNLKIDDTVHAENVADGGTTGRIIVEPGTRTISETEGIDGNFDYFDITVTCIHSESGELLASGLGTSLDIDLTGGEDIICTILNRLPSAAECDDMIFDNVILGTPGDDVLHGTGKRDIIIGYGGNDTIIGYGGDDCIAGGDGDDTIDAGHGNDVLSGDGGNDSILGGNGNDIIYGGAGNDVINGGNDHDRIHGEDGDDTLDGANGNDLIYGGAGNDILNGGNQNDKLYGGEGNDTLSGGNHNDELDGGPGIDKLNGGSGTDACTPVDAGGGTRLLCEKNLAPLVE